MKESSPFVVLYLSSYLKCLRFYMYVYTSVPVGNVVETNQIVCLSFIEIYIFIPILMIFSRVDLQNKIKVTDYIRFENLT